MKIQVPTLRHWRVALFATMLERDGCAVFCSANFRHAAGCPRLSGAVRRPRGRSTLITRTFGGGRSSRTKASENFEF